MPIENLLLDILQAPKLLLRVISEREKPSKIDPSTF